MFRKRTVSTVSRRPIRVIEGNFGRAHRIAKIVHQMYKNETWFKSTQISNDKDGPCIFLHVAEGSVDKDIAAFKLEDICIYPVCRKENRQTPVDADYWGNTRT